MTVRTKCRRRFSRLIDSCIFFFQAEDGIRDWSVTGVQTCALPISTDQLAAVSEIKLCDAGFPRVHIRAQHVQPFGCGSVGSDHWFWLFPRRAWDVHGSVEYVPFI